MKLRQLLFIASAWLMLVGYGVQAQEDEVAPIFEPNGVSDIRVEDLYWSSDSTTLFFYVNDHSEDPQRRLYSYSVISGELTEVDADPFFVRFTAEQQATLRAVTDTGFVSPDGQYVMYISQLQVYTGCCGGGDRNLFAVANLNATDSSLYLAWMPMRITAYGQAIDDSGLRVRWSGDSTAFTIELNSGYGSIRNIYYVTGFRGGEMLLTEEQRLGYIYELQSIFDISEDGRSLLLPNGLVLWEYGMPALDRRVSEIDGQEIFDYTVQIAGAAFEDDEHLILVNEQGIVRYNLTTQESELINPDINSTWVRYAQFSPDHQYVAASSNDGDLYVLPVD